MMRELKLLVLFPTILLFAFGTTGTHAAPPRTRFVYDDNSTDPTGNDTEYRDIRNDYDDQSIYGSGGEYKYQNIADMLNCSELAFFYSGYETTESAHDSIYTKDNVEQPGSLLIFDFTETPIELEETKPISKRSADENVTVIDGYSKVDYYPKVSNDSDEEVDKQPLECYDPLDGYQYNWYQVLINNGGPPGEVNATRLVPNVTEIVDPCRRPINQTDSSSEDLLYEYELLEFEKVYRLEKAFLRFMGTPSQFTDIVGQLVWAVPSSDLEEAPEGRRYHRITYRKDDTGLYVNTRADQKCVFVRNPLMVKCVTITDQCELPFDDTIHTKSLGPGLSAALIGR